MTASDAIVVGGGIVGGAVAFGLARAGARVTVFDEGDVAFRAARANFGNIAVQGKGVGRPEYLRLTRRSADLWPTLAQELTERTGVDLGFVRPGAMRLCLSGDEWNERARLMEELRADAGNLGYDYDMLDRDAVAGMVPGLGPEVVGASFTPYDCECSPLYALSALHGAIIGLGGRYVADAKVTHVEAAGGTFAVTAGGQRARAPRIVLAAGLGSSALAGPLGLAMPVRPERGQVIVTERTRRAIPMPLGLVRQTAEGGFVIGRSAEDVGLDDRTTAAALGSMAATALRLLPYLGGLQVVRAWGGLRIMAPDAFPIYDQSADFPGAFSATCHSGVTLAAAHAFDLAPAILENRVPPELSSFTAKRFGAAIADEDWVASKAP
ncbi:MAG: FAD-binding oxidoreductase [Rhodospirillales bacterium]|nr:FAD-binding oxidoreductase [Rhodospirillales bacterium]